MSQTKHVLIVEDLQSEIVLLTALFQEAYKDPDALKVTISFAKTLDAARDLLKKIRFDLVFLDGDLTGRSMQDEPDTLPLFKEIAADYRNRVFCTTSAEHYQRIMETHGCPHVEKEKIVEFTMSYLNQPIRSYKIGIGKLLVIQVRSSLQAYVAVITQASPLLVKAHDSQVPLISMDQNMFAILEDESALIQGSPQEQRKLFSHYERWMKKILVNIAEARIQLGAIQPSQS